MAVKGIRKISSWILIAACAISGVVFGLFYFGGEGETIVPNLWNPAHINTLLFWIYFMFCICAAGMVLFGIIQFTNSFKANSKKSLMTLGALAGFFLLLFLSYTLADDTPIASLTSPETQRFNVPFWLSVIDMWIYTIYVLMGVAVLAIIAGAIRKSLNK
jgi:hypothetical protein